ncbi:GPI-anchored protein, partial [Musa troglodytarum]
SSFLCFYSKSLCCTRCPSPTPPPSRFTRPRRRRSPPLFPPPPSLPSPNSPTSPLPPALSTFPPTFSLPSPPHAPPPPRSRCCPVLAAWLYAAYSPSALAARPLPSAGYDLPALPDDSESCAAGVERAMRDRGVALPRANATCDAAYCYCGVRLRRLACAGGFVADTAAGLWVPAGDGGRRLESDCAQPGLAGCSRCLRSVNQLKAKKQQGSEASGSERKEAGTHGRECQLMGVTWLLSRNRTLYLPSATAILRVLMAADAVGSSDPTSCSLSQDAMPLAVGSTQIDGRVDGSSASGSLLLTPFHLLLLALLALQSLLLHPSS